MTTLFLLIFVLVFVLLVLIRSLRFLYYKKFIRSPIIKIFFTISPLLVICILLSPSYAISLVDLIPVSECAGEAAGALNPALSTKMVNVFTILFP